MSVVKFFHYQISKCQENNLLLKYSNVLLTSVVGLEVVRGSDMCKYRVPSEHIERHQ